MNNEMDVRGENVEEVNGQLEDYEDDIDETETEDTKQRSFENAMNHETVDGVEMKRCVTCDALKPLNAFHKYTQSPDGYNKSCAKCVNARNRRLAEERAARGHVPRQRVVITEEDYQRAYAKVSEYENREEVTLDQDAVAAINLDDNTFLRVEARGTLPRGVVAMLRDCISVMHEIEKRKKNPFANF